MCHLWPCTELVLARLSEGLVAACPFAVDWLAADDQMFAGRLPRSDHVAFPQSCGNTEYNRNVMTCASWYARENVKHAQIEHENVPMTP